MSKISTVFLAGLVAFAFGCGGGGPGAATPHGGGSGPHTSTGEKVSATAAKQFKSALDAFIANDTASPPRWNTGTCTQVAKMFDDAASSQGKFPSATFDAGLAYQRCHMSDKALDHFKKALSDDPKFHHARVQLALYQYKADGNIDVAIQALQQAVLDAQFHNVAALVNLAMLQMQRGSKTGGTDCKDDEECAKKNLQRALAIDDSYMPAFNQLALFYFQQAKARAGEITRRGGRSIATNASTHKHADVQQLELAALVCSQAIRKNPNYAPIHNTAGLIQNELGSINGAVAEFATAARLDPDFFEAQMNYAAVNLSFRGFQQAQGAYERALKLPAHQNDYDAHLGLALALRGQINDANYDQQVAAVQSQLDACKKIDPARPDAYYNEGILTQEYKAKSGGNKDKAVAALKQAISILNEFVAKAGDKPEYKGAVKQAKDRIQDANDTITFLETPNLAPETPPPAKDNKTPPPAGGATPPPAAGATGTPAPAQPATPKK